MLQPNKTHNTLRIKYKNLSLLLIPKATMEKKRKKKRNEKKQTRERTITRDFPRSKFSCSLVSHCSLNIDKRLRRVSTVFNRNRTIAMESRRKFGDVDDDRETLEKSPRRSSHIFQILRVYSIFLPRVTLETTSFSTIFLLLRSYSPAYVGVQRKLNEVLERSTRRFILTSSSGVRRNGSVLYCR